MIDETLQKLRDHVNCDSAWFLATRKALEIVTQKKQHKVLYVKNFRTLCDIGVAGHGWESLRGTLEETSRKAMEFLDAPPAKKTKRLAKPAAEVVPEAEGEP